MNKNIKMAATLANVLRFSKPKIHIIGVLNKHTFKRLKMERNSFKEYSILAMISNEVQQITVSEAIKTCFDALHLTFDANRQWNRRR